MYPRPTHKRLAGGIGNLVGCWEGVGRGAKGVSFNAIFPCRSLTSHSQAHPHLEMPALGVEFLETSGLNYLVRQGSAPHATRRARVNMVTPTACSSSWRSKQVHGTQLKHPFCEASEVPGDCPKTGVAVRNAAAGYDAIIKTTKRRTHTLSGLPCQANASPSPMNFRIAS